MHFDRYTLSCKDGSYAIEPCQCRTIHENAETGKIMKCSEVGCGYTFKEAQDKLISHLASTINRVRECKTYKEYENKVK